MGNKLRVVIPQVGKDGLGKDKKKCSKPKAMYIGFIRF